MLNIFRLRVHKIMNGARPINFQRLCSMMTEAYACHDEWAKRLETPVFVGLDANSFIPELRKRFQGNKVGSAIDLDVAVNCARNEEELNVLRSLIYKIRHSKAAASVLPSTQHAFIRACLSLGLDEMLMTVLGDPINFGIFPDPFVANLAMDHFIRKGNMADASQIASSMMIQEEFRPSVCWMSVLSSLKWLGQKERNPWVLRKPEEAPADDDEEVIFRVPYLKNRIFDEHFDLTDPCMLLGKTMAWMCPHLPTGLGVRSAHLWGLRLFNKKESFKAELNLILASDDPRLCAALMELVSSPMLTSSSDSKETATETPSDADDWSDVKELLHKTKADAFIDTSIEEAFTEEMNSAWPQLETEDIAEQSKLFAVWNQHRVTLVKNKIRRHQLEQRLAEIEEQKKKFLEEEDLLFFFENKTKWEQAAQLQSSDEQVKEGKQELPSDDKYKVPELEKRGTTVRIERY
ncbi:28S ribosomal protein S27, mitochondrial [Trichuris trichiura]|uniref:28S ribosomal protein S27, mitochondrial n=1 Tax=Trichuris trichiura TaxID=36087 RepID=A0A077Z7T4_TRITR|nr:28S ribosomal protein S27, mitochondrial [Trichuris trichiura]